MKKRNKALDASKETTQNPSTENEGVDVELASVLDQDIRRGLDAVERWAPPKEPSKAWFVAMVASQQKAAKAKLRRELAVFFICAIIIDVVLIASLIQGLSLYLLLQTVLTLLLCVTLLWRRREREERQDG